MGIVLGGDLIATGQVNRIKGLEYNVCLYIKYQPHPTRGPVIRTLRLNVMASRSLAGGTTFMRSDCDSWLGAFALIGMSKPLTSFISPFERFHTRPAGYLPDRKRPLAFVAPQIFKNSPVFSNSNESVASQSAEMRKARPLSLLFGPFCSGMDKSNVQTSSVESVGLLIVFV